MTYNNVPAQPERGTGAVLEQGNASRWGLGHAVAGYVAGVVCGALASAAAQSAGANQPVRLLAGAVGLWIGLLGAVVHASRWRGEGSLRADFQFVFRPADVAIGLAAGGITQLAVIPVLYLPIKQLFDIDLDGPARRIIDPIHGAGLIALVFVLVVGAPLVEELFFRGVLLGAFTRRVPTWLAVVATSVVFGAVHFQLPQFPGLLVAGLVFAGLRVATGRLGPAIIAHAAFNAATVAALLIDR